MTSLAVRSPNLTLRVRPFVAAGWICLLAVTSGYRLIGGGVDNDAYVAFYAALSRSAPFFQVRFEPGFVLLAWLFKFWLHWSYSAYLTALVAVSLTLKFRLFSKYTSAPGFASLCYVIMLYPLQEYGQIRAAIGIAFAFTAVDCMLDRCWLLALLATLTGIMFHLTAIVPVMAAVVILWTSRKSTLSVLVVLGAAFLIVGAVIKNYADILALLNPVSTPDLNSTGGALNTHVLQSIVVLGVMLISAVTYAPWRRDDDNMFFCFSFCSVAALVGFGTNTVFAIRTSELFLMSLFFYPFRLNALHESRLPSLLVFANGAAVLLGQIGKGQIAF